MGMISGTLAIGIPPNVLLNVLPTVPEGKSVRKVGLTRDEIKQVACINPARVMGLALSANMSETLTRLEFSVE